MQCYLHPKRVNLNFLINEQGEEQVAMIEGEGQVSAQDIVEAFKVLRKTVNGTSMFVKRVANWSHRSLAVPVICYALLTGGLRSAFEGRQPGEFSSRTLQHGVVEVLTIDRSSAVFLLDAQLVVRSESWL
jgi:hypothetical protein